MESALREAACDGKEEDMRKILKKHPDIDVNAKYQGGWAPLHIACLNGHDKIVSLLLAHPHIRVNDKTAEGFTPFLVTCRTRRSSSCARVLLKDPRVEVNEPRDDGSTPLYEAIFWGSIEIIKWWVGSGREMDLGKPWNEKTDAIKRARKSGRTELASLLERFQENPIQTRNVIRKELGWFGEEAKIFALIIFLSDGLLKIGKTTVNKTAVEDS